MTAPFRIPAFRPRPSSGDGPFVTVIAAARNESREIDGWLEHLDWVDRVVVVDTGSRDGTPDLARERGADVIEAVPNGELIHAAKNIAIDAVVAAIPSAERTRHWILDLDLDERVTHDLRDEIRRRITALPGDVVAMRIPFRHYVFGRWLQHGGWRTKHLRLYRAGRARYPETRAHSTLEVDGAVRDLEAWVVHYAHATIHEFWTKMNRYTSQDAPLFLEHGRGGLRNRERLPLSRGRWLRASASVFWNRYIKAAGFRDGVPGFLIATLMAMYIFVEQAKAWELAEREDHERARRESVEAMRRDGGDFAVTGGAS